ncbi:MAG: alpha/beta fold hydrolase [Saprospiraceae bacterium]|nr:alpha/beta fold hydrolase [Saprospiraceae bacterium]
MKRLCILFLFAVTTGSCFSQQEVVVSAINVDLYGTLLTPESTTNKAILIISGSGKTDRDGNTRPTYHNDGLKKLAEGLAEQGYAVLRCDKRGVGKSISDSLSAEGLRFEQYVSDAILWIKFLRNTFEDITVIGHSQGALVGMLAIQENKVNRFISLAGLSEDAHTTVKRQLANQPQMVKDASFPILDSLKKGVKVDSVPQYLYSLFNPRIQDYFISFMNYDPRKEIKKLNCPILIIQGSSDLQITVEGAQALSQESPLSNFALIPEMNHVLRKSSPNAIENFATYNKPDLPLHEDLIKVISSFIN